MACCAKQSSLNTREKGHKVQISDQTNCGECPGPPWEEGACKSTINKMAVVKHTAKATGLSERTVHDIHKEHVARDGQVLTPVKRYTASWIWINPDTFDREAIRWLMHAFYIRREYPTIAAVLKKAKEECGFPGSRFCLWRVLNATGFTYKKQDNKKIHTRTDKHTFRLYTNWDKNIQTLYTQTRHGWTHISTNTYGLTMTG